MGSLDASYDLGFATLASTTSYYHTHGDNWYDSTPGVLALPYASYYTGIPANPRFNSATDFADTDRVVTEEVRLVSTTKSHFDYTLGFYYENESREDDWLLYTPGSVQQSQASGCNCIFLGPGDLSGNVDAHMHFTDAAAYGELTWHLTDRLSLTGGARFFWDTFSRSMTYAGYVFGVLVSDTSATSYHHQIFKANLSYEYLPRQQVYATFSQGFRRGGANAFAISGPLAEPASLLTFKPDTVDNYEIGFKGRLSGFRYTVDGFYDQWSNPQIGAFTPYNYWPVVYNGSQAVSKGVELEIGGPITRDLSYSFGYAYADAKLTKGFCVPAGDGAGGVAPCATVGVAGTTLPGAPKSTFSGDLLYSHTLGNGDVLQATLNTAYKSGEFVELPSSVLLNPYLPGYWTVNLGGAWNHGHWKVGFYIHNLLNTRGLVSADVRYLPSLGNIQLVDQITRPLSGGVTVGYRW
jgi:outer membrane receptor protein involved in Fe transport